MGWPPSEVRASTLAEFCAAGDGWIVANTADPDDTAGGLSADDAAAIHEMLEQP